MVLDKHKYYRGKMITLRVKTNIYNEDVREKGNEVY